MTTQRKALEASRVFLQTNEWCFFKGDTDSILTQIDAALAEPDAPHVGMHDPQAALVVEGEKRVSAVLRWESNSFHIGKMCVGYTWSSAAGQHGYLLRINQRDISKNANTEPEARAALEVAVLALLTTGEKAVGSE